VNLVLIVAALLLYMYGNVIVVSIGAKIALGETAHMIMETAIGMCISTIVAAVDALKGKLDIVVIS
jgi:hypothetical protein